MMKSGTDLLKWKHTNRFIKEYADKERKSKMRLIDRILLVVGGLGLAASIMIAGLDMAMDKSPMWALIFATFWCISLAYNLTRKME